MALILIVDDDPVLTALAEDALRQDGHQVLTAADGEEGLRRLRDAPVDLVVLDMLMPRKDGFETLMEIRRLRRGPRVLAISGGGRSAPMNYLGPARTLGADAIMEKPFSPPALLQRVRELLETEPALSP
ncbi:response regulator [Brevundimonas sp. S30B]|uniref:response regulator transcription factor n=1 Tax=unclassified Brevundimonas TaxID=2622653 RepID=UPI0010724AFF|nr:MULTISPECIES: response regulator [unclassified Brevundimonas]QBX37647.1 response regulator [Brevundimonas sp. MF30-B]TFW03560.1 response regulator [Brevundimonas sp. S30B]